MFGNQNQTQNSDVSNPPAPADGVQENVLSQGPANKGVEDIFENTDSGAPVMNQASQPDKDQQSNRLSQRSMPMNQPGPPSALTSGKIRPLSGSPDGVPASQVSSGGARHFPIKKFIAIIGISAGIIAISAGSYYIYVWRANTGQESGSQMPELGSAQDSPQGLSDEQNQSQDTEESGQEDLSGTASKAIDSFNQSRIDRALNPIAQDPASIDTDQDGLSDAKEFGLGTNPRLVDSDNDGLSDWEEVSIFGTDPLNRDSDGDSYLDGEEVQNGYNPLGAGKLINFDKADNSSE